MKKGGRVLRQYLRIIESRRLYPFPAADEICLSPAQALHQRFVPWDNSSLNMFGYSLLNTEAADIRDFST